MGGAHSFFHPAPRARTRGQRFPRPCVHDAPAQRPPDNLRTNRIWLAGGYYSSGVPVSSMETSGVRPRVLLQVSDWFPSDCSVTGDSASPNPCPKAGVITVDLFDGRWTRRLGASLQGMRSLWLSAIVGWSAQVAVWQQLGRLPCWCRELGGFFLGVSF